MLMIPLFIVIFCIGIWLSFKIAKWVQREIDRMKSEARAKRETPKSIWALIPDVWGLWHLYDLWHGAANGSLAKLGWGAALALIVAINLGLLIKLIDYRINGPDMSEPVTAEEMLKR